MDFYQMFQWVIFFSMGSYTRLLFENWKDRKENPYRWSCSECGFFICGNDFDFVSQYIDRHNELH